MTAESLSRRDGEQSAVQRIRALYQQRELGRGERLTTSVVVGEVGVSQTLAKATLRLLRTTSSAERAPAARFDSYASEPPSVAAMPFIASDRITAFYRAHEVAGGEHLRPAEVAQAAGVSTRYAMLLLYVLRALDQQGPAPRIQWAAARARSSRPADLAELARQRQTLQRQAPDGDWRARAACAEVADPDLFFPERSQAWKAAQARAICAGCVVQPACLHEALTGPQAAGQDQAGIFGGTSPQQRLRLRGRAPIAAPTRLFTDPQAAADALALARRVGVVAAARELGVSTPALYHAFDRHGLGRPHGQRGSPPSRVLTDRQAAEAVHERARQVGITRAAEEAGVNHRTLRKAWQRHGLGLPERAPQQRGAPSLDRVFLGLPGNEAFARPTQASGAALWARARRLEELETLGPRVVYEATTENRARPQTRVWRVVGRAREAIERQPAAADPTASRARWAERLQAAQAQRRAARAREQTARTARRSERTRARGARAEERER